MNGICAVSFKYASHCDNSRAALHASDTLTCALAHVEESVPCSAAVSIRLPVWGLAGMAGFSRAPPDQRLAAYLFIYLFIYLQQQSTTDKCKEEQVGCRSD